MVGETFNVCASREIICPARIPICDDPAIAIPVDTPGGLGFKAVAPGTTLCSAQASGRGLRRVFRITVRKGPGREERNIDAWAEQLKTSAGSRLLHEIGQQYGYQVLQGTKVVPVLVDVVQPLVDNAVESEGQGEYIGQVIEVLGHIGDERALPVLQKLESHPIAKSAIKEIEASRK